ncbi:hypothetical protein C7999DRAFT_30474 [Corynascus novoguineensis]|uniref:SP-RING-type domain-containing protein n=1 Tax=Corynascus novoguineensis TaxID=1126955 RepID=A0AAN7HKN7_9PEZI|nr:hypothetical protein C7999DRAFT_30474 [Corynascus novoguineensis]
MPPPQRSSGAIPGFSAAGNQIASSNATANAFLGGRQPSWITPGAPPRKPTSRPVTSRPTVAQATQQQQQQPAVLPSPAPSDEPSPALSNVLDSPKTNTASLTEVHNMPPISPSGPTSFAVTDTRFVQGASRPLGVQEAPRPETVGRMLPVENRPPARQYMSQPASSGVQITGAGYGRESPPTGSSEAAPSPKRRRIENPPLNSTGDPSPLPVLEQYIQASGGNGALEPTVERPRVMLLREACKEDDRFFLILHQLFSIWSLKREEAHQCLPLDPPIIDQAFAMLELVLKKNELLSPRHQHWFSQYPAPPGQLARWNNGQAVIEHITIFLKALVTEYGHLARVSLQRKYPFLVDELLSRLGCVSPVLQFILFTACRRRLGVPDDHFGNSMEQAFREDQNRHRGVNGQQILQPLTSPGEIEQRNSTLIDFYKLTVQAAAFRASGQTNHWPPSVHGNSQQRQIHHVYSTLGTSRPVYSSTAPLSSAEAAMAMANPCTTSRENIRAGAQITPWAAGSQACQQQAPAVIGSNAQSSVGDNTRASQPQTVAQYSQQQQAAFQGQQLRTQQLNQQKNQQQWQQDMPSTTSISLPTAHQSLTHSPTGSATPQYQRLQGPQSPRLQQVHYNVWVPHTQPMVSPTGFAGNGLHGSTRTIESLTPETQPPSMPQHKQSLNIGDPLFPPKGAMISRTDWPHDPSERKSLLMSLHQAHVRSPKRILKAGETERFYQAVKSLPVPPTAVIPRNTMYEIRFEVTKELLARRATTLNKPGEMVPVVEHFSGALRWRVRSCTVRDSTKGLTEQEWVALDTSWPSFIHMTLNNKVLDIRRQSHNGKDLPTEITDLLECGINQLMIVVHGSNGEKLKHCYLAVEMLETLSHSAVMENIWSQGRIPEEETLNTIKKRLTPAIDDDEISFEAADLSIDLADPFSAKIFKTPVRGASCTHMECFDLENWLNTRPAAKPAIRCAHRQVQCGCRNTAEPSSPDKWRCPICSKDARPQSLRIDEFLLKVRTQLEAEGKLLTKRLLAKADGTWSVVLEEPDDEDDCTDGEGPSQMPVARKNKTVQAVQASVMARREVEIIEID